jgi:hypothetical protein
MIITNELFAEFRKIQDVAVSTSVILKARKKVKNVMTNSCTSYQTRNVYQLMMTQ